MVPPWQVSALGGTWHDPLASLQLAFREDVEETDHQLWNLSGLLVPHLNITLFPIQDFPCFTHSQGSIPDVCLHSFLELPLPT